MEFELKILVVKSNYFDLYFIAHTEEFKIDDNTSISISVDGKSHQNYWDVPYKEGDIVYAKGFVFKADKLTNESVSIELLPAELKLK